MLSKNTKLLENWKLLDDVWMIQYWKYENENFSAVEDSYGNRKLLEMTMANV